MTSKVVMFRCAAAVLGAAALSGCAEYQERHQQELAAQAQAQETQDDATCRSNGVAPGSQEYTSCRMRIDNERFQERARVAAQLLK
jgi:outer membrane murein-binding lipoprotein Lpp